MVLFFYRNSNIWAVCGRPCAKGRLPYPSAFLLDGIWAARGGFGRPGVAKVRLNFMLQSSSCLNGLWSHTWKTFSSGFYGGVRGGSETLTHNETYKHRYPHKPPTVKASRCEQLCSLASLLRFFAGMSNQNQYERNRKASTEPKQAMTQIQLTLRPQRKKVHG